MRVRQLVRSLMLAGPVAMLSLLSIVSAVAACTGGADWPRLR